MHRKRVATAFVVAILAAGCASSEDRAEGPKRGPTPRVVVSTKHKAVFFVHGLVGDPNGTWRHADGPSWPDLIRSDPDLQSLAVATPTYHTSLLGRSLSVPEVTNNLLLELKDAQAFEQFDEIHFVTHSMGGIIVKSLLVQLNTPGNVSKLQRIKTVFLIGVPSQGTKAADLANWFSLNPQIESLRPAVLNPLLQHIEYQFQSMVLERDGVRPRIFCAHETMPLKGVLVVTRTDIATYCDEQALAVPQNHDRIVKPVGSDDMVYKWVKSRLMLSHPNTPALPEGQGSVFRLSARECEAPSTPPNIPVPRDRTHYNQVECRFGQVPAGRYTLMVHYGATIPGVHPLTFTVTQREVTKGVFSLDLHEASGNSPVAGGKVEPKRVGMVNLDSGGAAIRVERDGPIPYIEAFELRGAHYPRRVEDGTGCLPVRLENLDSVRDDSLADVVHVHGVGTVSADCRFVVLVSRGWRNPINWIVNDIIAVQADGRWTGRVLWENHVGEEKIWVHAQPVAFPERLRIGDKLQTPPRGAGYSSKVLTIRREP